MPNLICTACSEMANPLAWRCETCKHPLDFAELPEFDADKIIADDFSLWRYTAMIPVKKQIVLGEGMTPLVETTIDGFRFHAKLEYLNPTGSYKDRGTTMVMNHIASHDVREVVEDSSGNAGASVAAYSSVAGIQSKIYVPDDGSPAKKGLIEAFGGELVEVGGGQHAKTLACQSAAKMTTYASHAWSPYFILGQTTVAWEVWEQLGRRAPDVIVTPVGHGGLFLGFARGFKALLDKGYIDKRPKLIAVQSAGCNPVVQAWEQRAETTPVVHPTHTIADGIIVEQPVRGKAVLQALYETDGYAFTIDNQSIQSAQTTLAKHGLIVEPTSAVVLAAVPQIQEVIDENATVVMALTGNGLKLVNS